jgi:hypothetical protein
LENQPEMVGFCFLILLPNSRIWSKSQMFPGIKTFKKASLSILCILLLIVSGINISLKLYLAQNSCNITKALNDIKQASLDVLRLGSYGRGIQ